MVRRRSANDGLTPRQKGAPACENVDAQEAREDRVRRPVGGLGGLAHPGQHALHEIGVSPHP